MVPGSRAPVQSPAQTGASCGGEAGMVKVRVALVADIYDRWRFWMEPDFAGRLVQALDNGRYDRICAANWGRRRQGLAGTPPAAHRSALLGCGVPARPEFPAAPEDLLRQWAAKRARVFLMDGGLHHCARDWQRLLAACGIRAAAAKRACFCLEGGCCAWHQDTAG